MEEKNTNPIKAILYVSLWVIIWGTLGSLIDYPLYKINLLRRKHISVSYFHNYSDNINNKCKVFL